MASKNLLKKFCTKKMLLVVITVFALLARFWKIEFVPFQNDADELAFVFAGQSMLEKGVPISWSSFSYDEEYIYSIQEIGDPAYNTDGEITFISPWFDHPYLLSLLQGVWTEALGYRFPSTPPSLVLRIPMLVIAAVSLLLFWKVASALFDERAALLSYFVFALSPSFIIGQRMVVGENLIVPLLLGTLLILLTNTEEKFWLLPVLAVAAILTKMTGVLVLLVIGLWFFLKKDWKNLVTITTTSVVLFAVLYLPFVWHLGWSEFVSITSRQSFRLLGWVNPAFIMANPGFHHYIFYDISYYLVLIFGAAGNFLAPTSKKTTFLQYASLGTLVLLWSTSAEQDALGWYKLPLFSVLALMAGYTFQKVTNRALVVLGGLVVINNLGLVRYVEHPLPTTERLRLVVGSLVAVPVLGTVFASDQLKKMATKVALGVVVVACIMQALYIADSFYDAQCQHKKCPIPTITVTQWVRGQL